MTASRNVMPFLSKGGAFSTAKGRFRRRYAGAGTVEDLDPGARDRIGRQHASVTVAGSGHGASTIARASVSTMASARVFQRLQVAWRRYPADSSFAA